MKEEFVMIWYCVKGLSILYPDGRNWRHADIERAKKLTPKDFKENNWFIKKYPHGWIEVRDPTGKVIHTTQEIEIQLKLF